MIIRVNLVDCCLIMAPTDLHPPPEALAAGKLGGAKYQIRFVAPKTPATTSLSVIKPVASKAVGASMQSGGGTTTSASTPFGKLSSGLCGCGGATSFSLGVPIDTGVMEAHKSLNVMAEGMAELETA